MTTTTGSSDERGTPVGGAASREGTARGTGAPETTGSPLDTDSSPPTPWTGGTGRRGFLTGVGVLGTAALAGCSDALYPATPTDRPRRERTPRPTPGRSTPEPPANRYRLVRDASGNIEVEIPTTWTDIDGSPWDGGPRLVASPSIDGFWDTFTVPGVSISGSQGDGATLDEVLDDMQWQDCSSYRRTDYDDSVYVGRQEFLDCAGGDTLIWNIVARPANRAYLIQVEGQAITEADVEALGVVADTFFVHGV